MSSGRFFTIIEQPEVSNELDRARLENPRVSEVFDALTWRMAREPDCGTLVNDQGDDYRLVINCPIRGAKNPQILLRYVVDEAREEIVIDFAKVLPYDDALAYSPEAFDLDA
jgi:hypothetical protein